MLGCSIGNSKSQLHKARMKLRESLKTRRAEKATKQYWEEFGTFAGKGLTLFPTPRLLGSFRDDTVLRRGKHAESALRPPGVERGEQGRP